MKSYLSLSLFSLLFCTQAFSQNYTNDWIDKTGSQKYYKIKISTEGIYRIDYAFLSQQLSNSGVNIATVDPRNIQMFLNGIEQNIYVQGEGNGVFEAGEFIEFYGQKNDGTMDTEVYMRPGDQPHKKHSLFTDTATYFLTWKTTAFTPGNGGKRFNALSAGTFTGNPETNFIYESSVHPFEMYWDGGPDKNASQSYLSEYTLGEGWMSSEFRNTGVRWKLYDIPTPFYDASGAAPQLEALIFGKSDAGITTNDPTKQYNHMPSVQVFRNSINNYDVVATVKRKGYYGWNPTVTLLPTDIGTVTKLKFFALVESPMYYSTDYNVVSYATIRYPRLYDLSSGQSKFMFTLTGLDGSVSTGGNTYVRFNNFSLSSPLFYDLTSGNRITGDISTPGQARAMIPGHKTARQIYLTDASNVVSISDMAAVTFKPILPQTNNYQFVIITHSSMLSSANDYAAYRSSPAGGGYFTLVVTTDELYDQFYYGMHHPFAIRKFCDFLLKESAVPPQGMLLLGKGQANLGGYTKRFNGYFHIDFVPTIGTPPSDFMLTSGLDTAGFAPGIPTGRVSATSNEEVLSYLEKIKEYESAPGDLWRKEFLHLGGGQNSSQNSLFSSFLKGYENIAEGIHQGAHVTTYLKSTPVVSTTGLKGQIQDDINRGIGFLNYFGHGASEVLEINFGRATELNNKGKYPLMYYSGCTLGYSFDNKKTLGEEFLLTPDKGAIGWFAGTALGLEGTLKAYCSHFYNNAFVKNYGQTVGKIQQSTIKDFQDLNDTMNMIQCRQFAYQGDPMVKFYSPNEPDFAIQDTDLFIFPENASALSDSFALGIVTTNLGKAVPDSINISIKRIILADLSTIDSVIRVRSPKNVDTIYHYMKSQNINGKGDNKFIVTLNTPAPIVEKTSINNEAELQFFLPGTGVNIITPVKYGIVSSLSVKLVAQSSSPDTTSSPFIFQIDTQPDMDNPSPAFKSSPVIHSNFNAEWATTLPLTTDSTVYYWRVKLDVPLNEGGQWQKSSFMYINSSPEGWAQGDFFQFLGVSKNNIFIDTAARQILFGRYTSVDYAAHAAGRNVVGQRRFRKALLINEMTNPQLVNGMAIMAINPENEERFSYISTYNKALYTCKPTCTSLPTGGSNPIENYSGIYYFPTETIEGQDSLEAFINMIPNGFYVFMLNGYTDSIDRFKNSLYTAIETLGATQIRSKPYGHPYILFSTKGAAPGTAIEKTFNVGDTTDPADQLIQFNTAIYPRSTAGSFTSEIIGPSKKWKMFHNTVLPGDSPKDKIYFQVYGVDKNLRDTLFFDTITTSSVDLSIIDYKKFPFLKVRAVMQDSLARTPQRIKNWIVIYDAVPEGSINPNDAFTFYKDTLEEGDTLRVKVVYRNTSIYAMDSVLVQYKITDKSKQDKVIIYERHKALNPNDTIVIERSFQTVGLDGDNRLTITVNPDFDQPELNLYNNVFTRTFHVKRDARNPLLDVVVDGIHIMNRDIVSPNPLILITLNDPKAYRPIKDPASITVYLKKPGKDLEKADPADVKFTPATAQDSKASVEFTPKNLVSGEYELVVSAFDASGNKSGGDYSVIFIVDTRPAITNIYPYPNPFTSSMKFVFTLSGTQIPDEINIKIMTVTGKVVRIVTKEDLGTIRIGNNVSTFTWDGTDQFGDRLANGVYLYKVTTKLNGVSLEKREGQFDDTGFKADVGKIYLMR